MTLTVDRDTVITSDQFDPTGPAIAYGADDITVTIRAGILVGSGGAGIRSDRLSSRLINNGDINSGIADGVQIGNIDASILNNAGATIVGAEGILFDTGQGSVTNHGIIKGLATGQAGVFFGASATTDVLTNNGLVFGRTYGVQAFGDTINNLAEGVITAYRGAAIHLGTSFLRTNINNAAGATIKGALAIDGRTQDCGINLNNHGTIVGAIRGGDGTVAADTDRIFNHHLIKGSVSLGVGNDLYDGHDGKVTGPVSGNAGADRLIGGAAAEILSGSNGNDQLTGHGGADRFRFDVPPNQASNLDTITDFTHAHGDHIVLSKADFPNIGPLGALHAQFFRPHPNAVTANQHILYNQANGFLFYDQDGSNPAHAPIHFATLTTHPALVAGDFIVVA